ncbi:50S ribosomal protein L3 [bacterium HR19]|nr:50S ribosomal protein L3 [bacterium HR19]
MVSGLIMHKVGMTRIFGQDGEVIPVTLLKLSGGVVVGYKEVKGEKRVILAFDECKLKNIPKPVIGVIKKAGLDKGFRTLKEFALLNESELPPLGTKMSVDIFSVGELVDVTGTSKGRGFQGVVKRWGFGGGPASHGSMSHRRPGSIGQKTEPGRVWKGKKMAGHMGMQTVTIKNLQVVYVDKENEVIAVKGSVPGWIGGRIIVKKKKSGGKS